MECEVMKKKLDAYRKSNGQFRQVQGDLLVELLRMWESWTGESGDLAKKLGMRGKQLGCLIREGRKVATSTQSVDPAFHAMGVQDVACDESVVRGIEVTWTDKVIRFPTVETLIDFIKKAS